MNKNKLRALPCCLMMYSMNLSCPSNPSTLVIALASWRHFRPIDCCGAAPGKLASVWSKATPNKNPRNEWRGGGVNIEAGTDTCRGCTFLLRKVDGKKSQESSGLLLPCRVPIWTDPYGGAIHFPRKDNQLTQKKGNRGFCSTLVDGGEGRGSTIRGWEGVPAQQSVTATRLCVPFPSRILASVSLSSAAAAMAFVARERRGQANHLMRNVKVLAKERVL